MAKGFYVGVGNVAKKAKNIYIGVNGVAKKVKKIYLGVGGVAKEVWPLGFTYSYTGSSTLYGDVNGDWTLVLTTGGTLTISSISSTVDIFMVGGGKPGSAGTASYTNSNT